MIRRFHDAITPAKGTSLARSFSRLGWFGFWTQVALGALPVAVMAYYMLFSRVISNVRTGLAFVEWLAIINLAILAFTLFWSYRYTRLARRIDDPQRRPEEAVVHRAAWTGVVASTIGLGFSTLVLLIESATILFYFLKAPQAGMPVMQTSGVEGLHWVSTVDVLSIVALVFMLIAELIALIFSLWLLFRTTVSSLEYPKPTVL